MTSSTAASKGFVHRSFVWGMAQFPSPAKAYLIASFASRQRAFQSEACRGVGFFADFSVEFFEIGHG